MGDTYLYLRKELYMNDDEIKSLSVGKLNMILQRNNEPIYKQEIDRKLREQNGK